MTVSFCKNVAETHYVINIPEYYCNLSNLTAGYTIRTSLCTTMGENEKLVMPVLSGHVYRLFTRNTKVHYWSVQLWGRLCTAKLSDNEDIFITQSRYTQESTVDNDLIDSVLKDCTLVCICCSEYRFRLLITPFVVFCSISPFKGVQ